MKFISWNVNGLRAVVGKGFADIFKQLDADFFCLQETKMQAGQLDLEFEGYHSYWNYAEKKGYSGTAIYSRHEPIGVTYGIGVEEHDLEIVVLRDDAGNKSDKPVAGHDVEFTHIDQADLIAEFIHMLGTLIQVNNGTPCIFDCGICHIEKTLGFALSLDTCNNLNHSHIPP